MTLISATARSLVECHDWGHGHAEEQDASVFLQVFFKPKALDVFEKFSTGVDGTGRGLGYTQAWHRSSWSGSPYAVYNEFICGEIGRFLRLPIPPFAITYQDTSSGLDPLFSSLDFNFSRASLPRIVPEICVESMPKQCAGVLAFDILIANEDRHDENLLVDNVTKPRLMYVYDHDQALFGGVQDAAADRFSKLLDRLGITGSPITGGNRHVFIWTLKTCKHLFKWADRIKQIPEWFIEQICKEAQHYGLEKMLAEEARFFLVHRKDRIRQLIDANRSEFKIIPDWPQQTGELFQ